LVLRQMPVLLKETAHGAILFEWRATMDIVTKNLLEDFVRAQTLETLAESDQFERFANFCAISREFPETFDVDDVSVGEDAQQGLDGIATIVNGSLVTEVDEIEDLLDNNKYLEATFVFVQAKRSSSFSQTDIGDIFYAVKDFFVD